MPLRARIEAIIKVPTCIKKKKKVPTCIALSALSPNTVPINLLMNHFAVTDAGAGVGC